MKLITLDTFKGHQNVTSGLNQPSHTPNIYSEGFYMSCSRKSSSKSCLILFLKRGCGRSPFNIILNGNSSGGSGDFFMSLYKFIASVGDPCLKNHPYIFRVLLSQGTNPPFSCLPSSQNCITSSIFLHFANAIIKSLYR